MTTAESSIPASWRGAASSCYGSRLCASWWYRARWSSVGRVPAMKSYLRMFPYTYVYSMGFELLPFPVGLLVAIWSSWTACFRCLWGSGVGFGRKRRRESSLPEPLLKGVILEKLNIAQQCREEATLWKFWQVSLVFMFNVPACERILKIPACVSWHLNSGSWHHHTRRPHDLSTKSIEIRRLCSKLTNLVKGFYER